MCNVKPRVEHRWFSINNDFLTYSYGVFHPFNTLEPYKVYCSGKVYILIDTVLNQSYKELRAKLTGQQKNQLKTVQIRWVLNRDDTCAKLENDQVIMNLDCATEATVESFYYINAMNKSPSEFDVLLEKIEPAANENTKEKEVILLKAYGTANDQKRMRAVPEQAYQPRLFDKSYGIASDFK